MDRIVEYLNSSGAWMKILMKQLKKGDVFRIWYFVDYKNTWEPYKDADGETVWEVTCDPYIHPVYNVWTVHAMSWVDVCPIVLWDMEHLIYGACAQQKLSIKQESSR